MHQTAHLLQVEFKSAGAGMFFARSADPRLFISADSFEGLCDAIAEALERIFSERYGCPVKAMPASWQAGENMYDEVGPHIPQDRPWAIVPRSLIAAQAASDCH